MILALAQQHSGSSPTDLAYFWVGVLIALLPVTILGTIGFLVLRAVRRDRGQGGSVAPPGIPPGAEVRPPGR